MHHTDMASGHICLCGHASLHYARVYPACLEKGEDREGAVEQQTPVGMALGASPTVPSQRPCWGPGLRLIRALLGSEAELFLLHQ